eukprot:4549140-Amphidinium_carterae.2
MRSIVTCSFNRQPNHPRAMQPPLPHHLQTPNTLLPNLCTFGASGKTITSMAKLQLQGFLRTAIPTSWS